jgi:hypothetical protein
MCVFFSLAPLALACCTPWPMAAIEGPQKNRRTPRAFANLFLTPVLFWPLTQGRDPPTAGGPDFFGGGWWPLGRHASAIGTDRTHGAAQLL